MIPIYAIFLSDAALWNKLVQCFPITVDFESLASLVIAEQIWLNYMKYIIEMYYRQKLLKLVDDNIFSSVKERFATDQIEDVFWNQPTINSFLPILLLSYGSPLSLTTSIGIKTNINREILHK